MKKKKLKEKNSQQLYLEMGVRLRKERLKLSYTQEQMAESLEISVAYYGKIERGVHGLSLQKLLLLNREFGLDITYLLTGEEKISYSLEYHLAKCPKEKRYDVEQILRYALNLAMDDGT